MPEHYAKHSITGQLQVRRRIEAAGIECDYEEIGLGEGIDLSGTDICLIGGGSDRDQKTIKDPEFGIGLFTRYLIEGLAGRADEAPIGNDDKRIDTVELYVYTADAVRTAARKSFGLEQKPMLGKIDNLVVGNLSSN